MFFIFTKFVALTCVFCVGTAVLLDVGLLWQYDSPNSSSASHTLDGVG